MKRLTWAALAVAMMACGIDTPTEPPAPRMRIAGLYNLVTLNGKGMPLGVNQTDDLIGGSMTLGPDGTCMLRTSFLAGATGYDPVSVIEKPCWYYVLDAQLTFTYHDYSSAVGTLDGATLTVTGDTLTLVFKGRDAEFETASARAALWR